MIHNILLSNLKDFKIQFVNVKTSKLLIMSQDISRVVCSKLHSYKLVYYKQNIWFEKRIYFHVCGQIYINFILLLLYLNGTSILQSTKFYHM